VLTTTQYGASSKVAVSPWDEKPLVTWKDSVTGAPYANPMTEYRQSCTNGKGAAIACPTTLLGIHDTGIFTLEGTWQFQMPPPVAAITPQMTVAQLQAQQKKIADAVLALGGGGAQQEQPICTLSRYLAQKPEALPKNVVFVVLTDEDDTSPPDALPGRVSGQAAAEHAGRPRGVHRELHQVVVLRRSAAGGADDPVHLPARRRHGHGPPREGGRQGGSRPSRAAAPRRASIAPPPSWPRPAPSAAAATRSRTASCVCGPVQGYLSVLAGAAHRRRRPVHPALRRDRHALPEPPRLLRPHRGRHRVGQLPPPGVEALLDDGARVQRAEAAGGAGRPPPPT
jgi:hypothetical protein